MTRNIASCLSKPNGGGGLALHFIGLGPLSYCLLAWLDAIAPSIPPHPAFKTAIDLRPSSRFYSHSEVIGSFVGSGGGGEKHPASRFRRGPVVGVALHALRGLNAVPFVMDD